MVQPDIMRDLCGGDLGRGVVGGDDGAGFGKEFQRCGGGRRGGLLRADVAERADGGMTCHRARIFIPCWWFRGRSLVMDSG